MNSMSMQAPTTPPSRQRGAILVVSLVLLLIMTILAITISQTTRMQERMTGNARDSDLSFQAAEAGLRRAETFLETSASQPVACAAAGCVVYQIATPQAVLPFDLRNQIKSWWDNNAQLYSAATGQTIPGVTVQPQYVIQELGFIPDSLTVGKGVPSGRTFYRNTAHGYGGSPAAQAVIEGTYTRRY